jgi:hypothetical protein
MNIQIRLIHIELIGLLLRKFLILNHYLNTIYLLPSYAYKNY